MPENSITAAFINIFLSLAPSLTLLAGAIIFLCLRKYVISALIFISSLASYLFVMNGSIEWGDPQLIPGSARIVSASVRSSNQTADRLIKSLLEKDYEIILLQEVSDIEQLRKIVLLNGNYYISSDPKKFCVTLSRWPMESSTYIGNLQKTTILSPEKVPIIVYNLHAPKFFHSLEHYNKFFKAITKEIHNHKENKILIGGDFNSTKKNYWRRVLSSQGMTSALHDVGTGWLGTFPTKNRTYGFGLPIISIDDIYSKNIKLHNGYVLREHNGSDHYPLVATFEIPREQ